MAMKNKEKSIKDNEIDIFLREFPQLKSLQKLVSDDLILSEIASKKSIFQRDLQKAQTAIPTVNLEDIFPSDIVKSPIRLENFLGHWGNVTIEEIAKMCLIIAWLKPKKMLEMGTYNGMSTLQLALNAPIDCVTYTIDLSPQHIDSVSLGPLDCLVAEKFRKIFNTSLGSYFQGREKELRIEQLYGDTTKYSYDAIEGQIDFIFIDAAHDYESKKTDSINAFNLLSSDGVIVWHDYAQISNPDVTKYLAELAQEHDIFHLRNTNLAVYRSGHNR